MVIFLKEDISLLQSPADGSTLAGLAIYRNTGHMYEIAKIEEKNHYSEKWYVFFQNILI